MVTKTEGEREFGAGRPEHRGKNEVLAWSPAMTTVDRVPGRRILADNRRIDV